MKAKWSESGGKHRLCRRWRKCADREYRTQYNLNFLFYLVCESFSYVVFSWLLRSAHTLPPLCRLCWNSCQPVVFVTFSRPNFRSAPPACKCVICIFTLTFRADTSCIILKLWHLLEMENMRIDICKNTLNAFLVGEWSLDDIVSTLDNTIQTYTISGSVLKHWIWHLEVLICSVTGVWGYLHPYWTTILDIQTKQPKSFLMA